MLQCKLREESKGQVRSRWSSDVVGVDLDGGRLADAVDRGVIDEIGSLDTLPAADLGVVATPADSVAELAQRRGEVTAEVTSALALSEEQTRAVEDALQRVEGRNVALSLKVDPALIGGMVVKVGSRMIDSSLKTQLDRMKHLMNGAG